ncbi:hypothetical protein IA539_13725 [Gordonia sp. zg691]|uniref:Transcriptional regulator, AbiEi antitoxin, Type IV TA system n=2 Tax=Gordonia jinghuaiqii TaxID=2758710 RepID=A0A7D7RTT6_9ACTN|nr:hypothetical protein [Gordonia jinghuaiqii]MBD0862266.1 hypothetical protein [Gordonia jinghuaiqii]MCR5978510.1 hypothetical protein [Gordonia jinghuaiqii]QMT03773.1 hypothetical protein H1R19_06845 [Gordonia jinghuaiqii]
MDIPADSHGLVLRSEVVGPHVTDKQLQRSVADDGLRRLWPGIFADSSTLADLDKLETHRMTVMAAARAGGPTRIVSHVSAGAMHRLPMLYPDLTRVHVTSPKVGKTTDRVVRHQGVVAPRDVVVVDGVAVTSVARTACDVARLGNSRRALVVLDAALRQGAELQRMQEILESCRRFKGVEMLRRMLPLATAQSESVGESLSRALMLECADLPEPRPQVSIVDDDGTFIARVDFLLAEKLVGEFDGLVKYSGALSDTPPWQTVVEEKAREDKLRAQGYIVVRWTWQDLRDRAKFHALLTQGLRLAGVH